MQRFSYLGNSRRVKPVYRLVKHQYLGIAYKRKSYAKTLLHSQRELACVLFACLFKSDDPDDIVYLFFIHTAVELALCLEIVVGGHICIDARVFDKVSNLCSCAAKLRIALPAKLKASRGG